MTDQRAEALRTSYDELADVLYLSIGSKQKVRSHEDDAGIVWREVSDGVAVGATVQSFEYCWSGNLTSLISILSGRLQLSTEVIQAAVQQYS